MCFCFQNVKGFISVVFPFSEKHDCKQKFVNKDSFTGEVVKQQRNIHKAFKFVSVVKNIQFITRMSSSANFSNADCKLYKS